MKKTVSLILLAMLLFAFACPSFAANKTQIKVSASQTEATVGDEIEITVAFEGTPANNICVLELVVPIDKNAFSYVEGSALQSLEKASGMTTSAAQYREKSADVFCNWVDVQSVIPESTTTIYTFKVKVTEYAKNGEYTFALSEDSFLTDVNIEDIFFDAHSCKVAVAGSPETPVETEVPNAQVTPDGAGQNNIGLENVADPIAKGNDSLIWIIIGAVVLLGAGAVIFVKAKKK
ncbi:MAG: hypothetical protein IJF80_04170 [Clostridia bacterium]|nr:hypothetical protein [Clostridia bacterium]